MGGPILPYFSSLPLDDTVAICSSEVLPHRLLLVMVLSALFSFSFFLYMHGYYWNIVKEQSGVL